MGGWDYKRICNIREISELSFLYGTGVYKKKKAMLHLFRSVEKEKLLSNMNEIAYHIICTYANEMKEKRNISEQDKETLIQCYKCFFVGSLLEWLERDATFDLGKFYEDAYRMLSNLRK